MKNYLRDLIFGVFSLVPMLIAAAVLAGFIGLVNHFLNVSLLLWVFACPVLYVSWLVIYLYLGGLACGRVGKKYPKPRYQVYGPDLPVTASDLGLLTLAMCYMRLNILDTLPLAWTIARIPSFKSLALRAYSPSIHIGKDSIIWGFIVDPDLTEVGDHVVIGTHAVITAHADSVRPNGHHVYVSAPVRIGNRATIGGQARVALGCVIGEDAIVEQGSVVPPFTQIPADEVWAGNPACFQRMRDASPETGEARAPETSVPSEITDLVRSALGIEAEGGWDSLGQVAIAAALFDRYGISVGASQVFRLHSLQEVANLVAGQASAPSKKTHAPAEATLPRDLELLPLLETGKATRVLAAHFQTQEPTGQRLRVVVAATFVAQPIAQAVKLWGKAFGLDIDCEFAGYNQLVQALLDGSGPFALNADGANVILARPEDFGSGLAQMDQVLNAIATYASMASRGQQLLVGTLPPVVSPFAGLERNEVDRLRQQWRARVETISGVELLDFSDVVEQIGIAKACSSESEVLTRGPYSPPLYQELGVALVRCIRAKRRSPAKVIAVDCDNTLWGGIVGELGIEGVELGPDGPGRAFQLFQQHLKRLKKRGFLLAIVSRNEERDVRDMFDQHPEMVLRAEDIVAWRVNWKNKSQNLRDLADELNVGLDSFVFVDDDPVNRMEVENALPQVHVVPLTENPAGYCETLGRLWLFDGAAATDVDSARTEMMQVETLRKQERKTAASLEEYLAGLELRVEMGRPSGQEWARVAQLTQRTNQFNLSLRRRSLEEVTALGPDSPVFTIKASDRFGDYGLVGVAILQPGSEAGTMELETLLMSCRALGRGVEDSFLHGIANASLRRGAAQTLIARFIPGPRNQQIQDFLRRSGFNEYRPNVWELSLERTPALPAHVRFEDAEWTKTAMTSLG